MIPDEVGDWNGESPVIGVEVECDSCVNYALQQNAVPFVKRVRLTNNGSKTIEPVTVRIVLDPGLSEPIELRIDSIGPSAAHVIDVVSLPISAARLVAQTERELGALRIEVVVGDVVVARAHRSVEVLAYNEWAGTRSLPEILAAFVLPNHPVVARILRDASDLLGKSTGDAGLAGYQARSPDRVRAIAAAIYRACARLDLTYISPPASFESNGQKVRTPDQILDSRMGTCLDLTLLFAAALEQAGLHPLLVLPKGHALVGVWLDDETFPQPTLDDVTRIRKRVELGQIAVFETTTITARPVPSFEDAVRAGVRHLQDADRFHMAVDVRAARQAHIRPIPLRVDGTAQELAPTPPIVVPSEAAKTDGAASRLTDAEAKAPRETGPARLERWKRRLLDLSLRNRLLNYHDTKATVPLLCPDVSRLEDKLADGLTFDVLPEPDTLSRSDPRSPSLFPTAQAEDSRSVFLQRQLDARRLHAALSAEDLESRLTQVFRASRESLEEGGANTLFLAIGFLRWFETKTSGQARLAPILLLPLQLERRTVVEGFKLKLADEDPVFNVTLLQKLSADFGLDVAGLESLDEDQSGLDVPLILRRIRRAVLSMDRWEVVEDATIGLFSFTKYLMWRDLEKHTDRLLQHPVVRHLVENPDRPFAPDTRFPDLDRMDAERDPANTFCPLDADSSQLRAVYAAADGATFVLEGPPGTGKSQTIANLIANAVAAGQRVLFVSEKMAALNVVRKRLAQVGLGPYCLELHSNKAQKRAVMDQLRNAIEASGPAVTSDWAAAGGKLRAIRGELNAYADALHRVRKLGMSVHAAIARLVELRGAGRIVVSYQSSDSIDRERLALLRERVHSTHVAASEVGDVARSPWRTTGVSMWEPGLTEAITEAVSRLTDAARAADGASAALSRSLGLPDAALSMAAMRTVVEVGRFLASSPGPAAALLTAPDREAARAQTQDWARRGKEQQSRIAALREKWRDEALGLDLGSLRSTLARANASLVVLSWWRARAPRRTLSGVWRGDSPLPTRRELVGHVDRLLECREGREQLAAFEAEARGLLAHGWRGVETDWANLACWLDWTDEFHHLIARTVSSRIEDMKSARDRWIPLVTNERAMFATDGPLRRLLADAEASLARVDTAIDRVCELFSAERAAVVGRPEDPSFRRGIEERAKNWIEGAPKLRAWCAWRRTRAQAVEAGLYPLIESVEDGRVEPKDAEIVFERSFLEWWVASLFRTDASLREFSRAEHEDKIRRFRNLDIHVIETAHEVVSARVSERVPRGSVALSSQSSSDMGVLHRELKLQRGHTKLRALFRRIPDAITRLKPCFLMSPLSIAQYLDFDFPAFDVVVFDEASQIPAWDAIGAIARGTRLVVVGDSQQLPPTNFFARSDDEEVVDEDEIQDLESILDECRAARLPPLELKWHYRSRHESLIAFSNHNYYKNGLLTFPSAHLASDTLGLAFRHQPEGVYDRGKSRANRVEAEALVEHLLSRLRDPVHSEKSIGIVTFSVAQQSLVEDLLDAARRTHPEIEPHFAEDQDEPIFVKNLENVQGDERDVILFSVCYGPDQSRNVAMNFGPLNRDGGERRLNVAITRAREQLVVFSSLRADDIDLARSRAVGVRHLKDFLDYAERGPSALGTGLGVSADAECESPFEEDVRLALEERGWEVHPQVGCSGYRVDLGVKDPAAPGRFLLGIECDGAMYHSGKTARDRDRLRQAVLEGLGWKIHRIWSTDWWQARDAEIERVQGALLRLKNTPTTPALKDAPPAAAEKSELFASAAHVVDAARRATEGVVTGPRRLSGGSPYVVATVWAPRGSGEPAERFYGLDSAAEIRSQVETVLAAEAPIEETLLAERVASTWGLQRVTPRVVARVRQLLGGAREHSSSDGSRRFLWRDDQSPSTYREFRVPLPGEAAPRDPERIPIEEIANAAVAILRDQVRMDRSSLSRELGRVFGFSRLGVKVEAAMGEGIGALLRSGRAVLAGDSITLAQ